MAISMHIEAASAKHLAKR